MNIHRWRKLEVCMCITAGITGQYVCQLEAGSQIEAGCQLEAGCQSN